MASAWASFACYFVMMLVSYFYGQKHMPIQYNLKSIGMYTVLALALFVAGTFINTPYIALNLSLKTILLIIFVVYIVKKDLPLSRVPFIKKYIK
jgi:phosphate starvation-inducible membrane PsiE